MATNCMDIQGTNGSVHIEALPDGRHRVSVTPNPGHAANKFTDWITAYPVSLIREIHSAKDLYVCDEIMREEDPGYVERSVRHDVFRYVQPEAFAGKRILDFGCGAGASSIVLSRLVPPCEIVAVELVERFLQVARLRAQHFGRSSIRFLQSPSPESLPAHLGHFDFILFSAVFEHLLPNERRTLVPKVWEHLRPGGVLFLYETPYRYAPVERHTTGGMPLINYLPDWLTWRLVTRFCQRVSRTASWETLLRQGIRGGTAPEVVKILGGSKKAVLLRPLPPIADRIDLWYSTVSSRHTVLKRSVRRALKVIKAITGEEITPDLSLAICKRE